MKRLSRLSVIALGALLSTAAVPALVVSGVAAEAQAATLSGGFDVGPGGFRATSIRSPRPPASPGSASTTNR